MLSRRVRASLLGALLLLVAAPPALAQEDPPPGAGTPPVAPDSTPPKEEKAPASAPESDTSPAPSEAVPVTEGGASPQAPSSTPGLVPRPTAPEEPAPSAAPVDPPSTQQPQKTQEPDDDKPSATQLKARLDAPKARAEPRSPRPNFPQPALRPEAAHPVQEQADRTVIMPGNYVARPVTLPKGTFRMEFGQGLVLGDVEPQSAMAPAFALGITERFEIGVDAPLHHDPGRDDWVSLHPRPHIAVTWVDKDAYEIGTRIRALIPARASLEPSAAIAVPVLWRASPDGRVDVIPELHLGVGDDEAVVARLSATGIWQISPGMFAGLGGTANVGFLDSSDTGFDPELTFGLTHQNYGRSFVDFVTHIFAKSIAGGGPGHFSKGAGFELALVFYPELY